MKRFGLIVWASTAAAQHLQSYSFPGYGFSCDANETFTKHRHRYDPPCGFACWSALSSATLSCTEMDHSQAGGHHMSMTSPECQANDTALLTSMAYCMNQFCPDSTTTVKREEFWGLRMLDTTGAVQAKWTYGRALSEVQDPPTQFFNSSSTEVLTQTVLVDPDVFGLNNRFNVLFDHIEALQSKYAFVILSIGVGSPILLSLLRYLPFMSGVVDKVKPYIIYPSIVGTYHVRPLPWLLGNAPTVGQALWVFMFFAINLVLNCVNYQTMPPGEMPWGFTQREEILAYVGYRTGHLGYMILPLVILFSGRNNFLLWITDWSYDTYLVLHRWVARIFALYAIIHSFTLLGTYTGSGSYPTASKEPYWLWGIVATVLTCAMLVFSMLWFRKMAYEAFLIMHILMAVFVIAGCWYHVILKWGYNWYDNWLYAAMAVWGFDRLIRILRIFKHGVRRAVVTELGSDHVRVDIPGLRWVSQPGYVAYAYFPTANKFRPWENHPFSVNATSIFHSFDHTVLPTASSDGNSSDSGHDPEKAVPRTTISGSSVRQDASGLTLIIKKSEGLTGMLKSHNSLVTLIDGPYPQKPYREVLKCDHLLLIGGGIGITGLIAWISSHPDINLAWSVKGRHEALVKELDVILAGVAKKQIVVGERLDIDALLREASDANYRKVGVVVCGPAGMCDDVRAKVSGLGRSSKTAFELEVDAFSW